MDQALEIYFKENKNYIKEQINLCYTMTYCKACDRYYNTPYLMNQHRKTNKHKLNSILNKEYT